MQPEQCRELLQKKLYPETLKYLSEDQLNNLSSYIINKHISYENMENLLIPDLKKVQIPKNKEKIFICLLKNIDNILDYRRPYLAVPQKKIKNDSKKQRDYDRLARVLAPSGNVTPCIAVAFCNGALLIGLNTPKKKFTHTQVQEMVEKKLALLRILLVDVKNEYERVNPLDLNDKPQFAISLQADFYVFQRALFLQRRELGGTSVRNSIKYGITERLKVDLLKLARVYLEGLISQGNKGFSIAECQTLEQGKPKIYFPDSVLETENLRVHADQLLLKPISSALEEAKTEQKSPTEIGINKLSCRACAGVLKKFVGVTHRGTSDISYPNTLDISTQEAAPYTPTQQPINCLYATDSASEVEVDTDSTQQVTDKLITNASQAFLFFKIIANRTQVNLNINHSVLVKS